MDRKCCAKYCEQQRVPGKIFFKFPDKSDTQRWLIWRKRLKIDTTQNSTGKLYACHNHFSPSQYKKFGPDPERNKLSRDALPDQALVRPFIYECRFCLEPSDCSFYVIYNEYPNPDVPTPDEIQQMLGIQLDPDDKLPQAMCVTCVSKIKYIKRIRTQFQENDQKLRQRLLSTSSQTPDVPSTEKLQSVDVSFSNQPVVTSQRSAAVKIFPADEDDVLVSFCPKPDLSPTKPIAFNAGIQRSNADNAQLITADEITVVGEDEEIESTPVVKSEMSAQEASTVDHSELLYTGNFVESSEVEQMVEEQQYEDFDYLDYFDDSQSDDPELSPEAKPRVYRPFRYTKRQRTSN